MLKLHNVHTPRIALLALTIGLGVSSVSSGCSSDPAAPQNPVVSSDRQIFQELSLQFLDEHLASEGISRRDFQVLKVNVDELGMAHTRVQQMVNGVPVLGGEMIVHLRPDGGLFAVTDSHVRGMSRDVETTPRLTAEEATSFALLNVDCASCVTGEPQTELLVLYRPEMKKVEPRLAYRVQLNRMDGSAQSGIPVLFIDAESGEELWRYDNLQTGSGATHYSGNVFIETTNLFGAYVLLNSTQQYWTINFGGTQGSFLWPPSNPTDDWDIPEAKDFVETHYNVSRTFTYFFDVHGRKGIDDEWGPSSTWLSDGSGLVIVGAGYGADNLVAWQDPFFVVGQGDGVMFGPMTALDMAAHELTHGITSRTAKLLYAGESGAVNESMSDVFAAMVEQYAGKSSWDVWRFGEDAYTPATPDDALRYLDKPHDSVATNYTPDDDPDHYSERYMGGEDNGGVHVNSGIGNKAFYMVAEGGIHHLGGSMAEVGAPLGIGSEKAAAIWYKALTTYMTSSTDYAGARQATILATKALHGAGSLEEAVVTHAWDLVGVGVPPPPSCPHKVCETGDKLDSNCNACTTKLCAIKPQCCSNAWDDSCVTAVQNICGMACPTCKSGAFSFGAGLVVPHPVYKLDPAGQFTIAFSAKFGPNAQTILYKGTEESKEWSISLESGGILCTRRPGLGTPLACVQANTDTWHHYIYAYNAGAHRWYIDGVPMSVFPPFPSPIGAPAESYLVVGNDPFGLIPFSGEIESMAIWQRLLTSQERQKLVMKYAEPFQIPNLMAQWNFADSNGSVVPDKSGHGLNMDVQGVTLTNDCLPCLPYATPAKNASICIPPRDCAQIKSAIPSATSGMYMIDPDGLGGQLGFSAYCDMDTDGGGWTLLFNAGPSFDTTILGSPDVDCTFAGSDCTSLTYSTLPVYNDLRIDADDAPFSKNEQGVRTVITGLAIWPEIAGKFPAHTMMNYGSNWTLDNADNSNVTSTSFLGDECSNWVGDYSSCICAGAQLVLNDTSVGCGWGSFALGISSMDNCAGWPKNPNDGPSNHWPDYVRMWTR